MHSSLQRALLWLAVVAIGFLLWLAYSLGGVTDGGGGIQVGSVHSLRGN